MARSITTTLGLTTLRERRATTLQRLHMREVFSELHDVVGAMFLDQGPTIVCDHTERALDGRCAHCSRTDDGEVS